MKNKRSLYILFPSAAALWGYIIYLVVVNLSDGNQQTISGRQPTVFVDSLVLTQDSFGLSLAYEDPFLKKTRPVKATNTNLPALTKPSKPSKPTPPTVNWPSISVGGSIAGAGTKKEVIILVIGNEETIAKEGDVVKGIKITHIAPNAIGLEYQGSTKTISR